MPLPSTTLPAVHATLPAPDLLLAFHALYAYDSAQSCFWHRDPDGRPSGRPAGSRSGRRLTLTALRETRPAEAVAWALLHGAWPAAVLFRDGDPGNLRADNLTTDPQAGTPPRGRGRPAQRLTPAEAAALAALPAVEFTAEQALELDLGPAEVARRAALPPQHADHITRTSTAGLLTRRIPPPAGATPDELRVYASLPADHLRHWPGEVPAAQPAADDADLY